MSSLSKLDEVKLEKVFGMETGYVGHYSNNTFQNLIIEITGIDVYEGEYNRYTSKAKKLRHFIDVESDAHVGKVISALLDEREVRRIRIYDEDEEPDPFETYVKELRKAANNLIGGVQFSTNEERLKADIAASNAVLADLITISEKICTNAAYNQTTLENTCNDYYRDMLLVKGYEQVHDQTRHGISESGKGAGSVDLLMSKDGREMAIIEAFRLSSIDQKTIKTHIDKAIINYNALGTPTFLLIYAGDTNFGKLWSRFFNWLKEYQFPLPVKREVQELAQQNAATRICNCILSRDDYDFPVTFLAVNLYKSI